MKVAKRQHDERLKVSIPFRDDELSRFKLWLEATGRKAGPYLRAAAMDSVREWEELNSIQNSDVLRLSDKKSSSTSTSTEKKND